MPQTPWERPAAELAVEVAAACARILDRSQTVLDDASMTMLAQEEDPQIVPSWPIGTIYRYRVHERRVYRLFGIRWLPIPYRKQLVSFGLEEMYDAPRWAFAKGVWCSVEDARLVEPIREIMRRFSFTFRIDLHFHPPRAA